ncbi:glycerophosphodiester phosphodiesterase [Okeania hirsuta]|uniref:glycerophosphodiester phosphodiesterase n=1 Tax=Okeania hirsuta TaxID=1458930 RepID=UPI0035C8DBD3
MNPKSYRTISHNFYNRQLAKEAHAKSMKIIPWTVNETTLMDSLLQMGVDGIITDYPDRIPEIY